MLGNSPEMGYQPEEIDSIIGDSEEQDKPAESIDQSQIAELQITDEDLGSIPQELLDVPIMENARLDEIRDMAESTVDLINLAANNDAETVFFLDKSARPMGYLFLKTWDGLYPEKERPQIRFVDIGRRDDKKFSDEEALNELRETYKNSIDGKRVLVCDEHSISGGTLVGAKNVLESTFPTGEFTYTTILKEMPQWYGHDRAIGVVEASRLAPIKDGDPAPETFISTTYSSKAEDPNYAGESWYLKEAAKSSRAQTNEFRKGLAKFSEYIIDHCTKVTPDASNKPKPFIPERAVQAIDINK